MTQLERRRVSLIRTKEQNMVDLGDSIANTAVLLIGQSNPLFTSVYPIKYNQIFINMSHVTVKNKVSNLAHFIKWGGCRTPRGLAIANPQSLCRQTGSAR